MKDDTLRKVFYNASTGFGSIAKTYRAAKALDDSVTLAATRDFIGRQDIRQKAKYRTDNSYVAPGPRDTVQFDLADFRGFGPSTQYRYALIGTDVFTKPTFARTLKGENSRGSRRRHGGGSEDLRLNEERLYRHGL